MQILHKHVSMSKRACACAFKRAAPRHKEATSRQAPPGNRATNANYSKPNERRKERAGEGAVIRPLVPG